MARQRSLVSLTALVWSACPPRETDTESEKPQTNKQSVFRDVPKVSFFAPTRSVLTVLSQWQHWNTNGHPSHSNLTDVAQMWSYWLSFQKHICIFLHKDRSNIRWVKPVTVLLGTFVIFDETDEEKDGLSHCQSSMQNKIYRSFLRWRMIYILKIHIFL